MGDCVAPLASNGSNLKSIAMDLNAVVNVNGIPRIVNKYCGVPLTFNSIISVGTSVGNLIGSGVSNTLSKHSLTVGVNPEF